MGGNGVLQRGDFGLGKTAGARQRGGGFGRKAGGLCTVGRVLRQINEIMEDRGGMEQV